MTSTGHPVPPSPSPSPILSSYTERVFYARRPLPSASAPPSASPNRTPTIGLTCDMPRPNPPPTPGSSSDIRGRESTNAAPAFHLPPAAYEHPDRASTASAASSTNGSDSSYQPISPTSPAGTTRKRPAAQAGPVITKEDFSLPPPPTRSRKIIQMKPRESEQQQQQQQQQGQHTPVQPTAATSPQPAPKSTSAGQGGGKRKQGNAGTTAAGRKIARKTAHSLIERRRRSKMNEEFGVLKDMIPACQGQEMHKLAILQASIEYLRYLEQCVSDLQAQSHSAPSIPPPPASSTGRSDRIDEEEDEDEEMEDDHHEPAPRRSQPSAHGNRSGSLVSLPPLSQITSTASTTTASPSVFSTNGSRHYSMSSAASHSGYSPLYSNQTSPAFGPQLQHFSAAPGFGLGSPALKPQDPSAWHLRQIAEGAGQHHLASSSSSSSSATAHPPAMSNGSHGRTEHELDQEATAALLMLNNADRRNWRQETETTRTSTGMSVKDLLSG